jgi:translation initiation factor IF-1
MVTLYITSYPTFGRRGGMESKNYIGGGICDRNWKNTIKISEKDNVVVSVSVLFRVPCARCT